MFRAFTAPVQKHFERDIITFGFNKYISVRLIPYAAFYAKLVGYGFGSGSVKYTLYLAFNGYVEMFFHFLVGMLKGWNVLKLECYFLFAADEIENSEHFN